MWWLWGGCGGCGGVAVEVATARMSVGHRSSASVGAPGEEGASGHRERTRPDLISSPHLVPCAVPDHPLRVVQHQHLEVREMYNEGEGDDEGDGEGGERVGDWAIESCAPGGSASTPERGTTKP